jgi:cytochrome o ubiquinol oxidase subunit 2
VIPIEGLQKVSIPGERKMKKIIRLIFVGIMLLGTVLIFTGCDQLLLFNPKGPVGDSERSLIIISFVLMLIVVIPVFIMAFWFSLKYRASNTRATYAPKWDYSAVIDWVIWLVPVLIVTVLAYLAWSSTFSLDPYKSIHSENKPLRIEVVSMDWNWLFIYPDKDIAVVNELVLPSGVPVNFRLTSATVMTSFFIPQLGSQIYAMAGMQTRLHLLADEPGTYTGQNQEFSGDGYADMHFQVKVTSSEQFEEWVKKVKQSPDKLDLVRYEKLSRPTNGGLNIQFGSVRPGLFEHIMSEYMGWMGNTHKKHMQMEQPGM